MINGTLEQEEPRENQSRKKNRSGRDYITILGLTDKEEVIWKRTSVKEG